MKIKAVFFDMDGTLVNSMEDLAVATNFALKKHGYEERPVKDYAYFAGSGIYVMIERALAPDKVSDEELREIRNDFFAYYEKNCTVHTTVYPGVQALVKKLRENGIYVCCVTNKVEPIAIDIIHHFFGGMDKVAGQVDSLPTKPDPTRTLDTIKALHISPEECLFVGDSAVDIETAKNSGAVPLGVLWGFRTEEELRNAGARYIVKNAEEILEVIKAHE